MEINRKKVILYKVYPDKKMVDRVVFTDHVENWKLVYEILGDKDSRKILNSKDLGDKKSLVDTYRKNGYKSFREINPQKTVWEEYYITNDNDLKDTILKWNPQNILKKRKLKGVKSSQQLEEIEVQK